MAEPLLSRMPSPTYDGAADNIQSRKMKPLPKRRRISDMLFDANDIAATQAFLAAAAAAATEQGQDFTLPGHLPGSLSDYYMPLLAGMQDILRSDLKLPNSLPSTQLQPQFPAHSLPPPPKEEEDHNEYVDHLEQPGNTKKRKVPLVRQTAYPGYPADFIGEPEGIPESELPNIDRRMSPTIHEMEQKPRPPDKYTQPAPVMPARRIRLSRATRAWLSNKEMLKTRKRQLTAVLGAMYTGDSPALDQALSSVQPFAKGMSRSQKEGARVRFSHRTLRVAARRALRTNNKASAPSQTLNREFTFSVLCATSERLVSMREEVSTLHAKFEKEWAAQSVRNAEAAKRAARKAANAPGTKDADISAGSKPKGGSKKKRRSALANASNPHHLRNYVPSRLPNSGPPPNAHAAANQQSLISPLALRFLSAQLPPKRRGSSPGGNGSTASQLTTPGDEWICAFCEYDLFYGDEARFHRAVRNRKKILKRRRRAREKAAATASGTKAAGRAATVSSQGEEDGGGEDDESVETRGSDGGDPRGGGVQRERERAPG